MFWGVVKSRCGHVTEGEVVQDPENFITLVFSFGSSAPDDMATIPAYK